VQVVDERLVAAQTKGDIDVEEIVGCGMWFAIDSISIDQEQVDEGIAFTTRQFAFVGQVTLAG
jgi:hypothetical protein